MKSIKIVYLAGAITPDPRCTEWRGIARFLLGNHFEVVDPADNEYDRKNKDGSAQVAHADTQGVFLFKDYVLVRRSDIILMNLALIAERPLIGTIFELAWCFKWHKIVVGIGNGNVYCQHPFVIHTLSAMTGSVEEACKLIRRTCT